MTWLLLTSCCPLQHAKHGGKVKILLLWLLFHQDTCSIYKAKACRKHSCFKLQTCHLPINVNAQQGFYSTEHTQLLNQSHRRLLQQAWVQSADNQHGKNDEIETGLPRLPSRRQCWFVFWFDPIATWVTSKSLKGFNPWGYEICSTWSNKHCLTSSLGRTCWMWVHTEALGKWTTSFSRPSINWW